MFEEKGATTLWQMIVQRNRIIIIIVIYICTYIIYIGVGTDS